MRREGPGYTSPSLGVLKAGLDGDSVRSRWRCPCSGPGVNGTGFQVPSAPSVSASLCNAPSTTGGHVTAAAAALPPGTRSTAGSGRRPGQIKAKVVAPAARPGRSTAGLCSGPTDGVSSETLRSGPQAPRRCGYVGARRWARRTGDIPRCS